MKKYIKFALCMFLTLTIPVKVHAAANAGATIGQCALKTLSGLIVGISTVKFASLEIERLINKHLTQKPEFHNPVVTPALPKQNQ